MKLTPEQKEQVSMLIIECATLAACVAFVLGYLAHMFVNQPQTIIKTVYAEPAPLSYDQQHLLAYDFMVDNPHVRYELCNKRFTVMDSDRSGK